jgi:hypothetical protein
VFSFVERPSEPPFLKFYFEYVPPSAKCMFRLLVIAITQPNSTKTHTMWAVSKNIGFTNTTLSNGTQRNLFHL